MLPLLTLKKHSILSLENYCGQFFSNMIYVENYTNAFKMQKSFKVEKDDDGHAVDLQGHEDVPESSFSTSYPFLAYFSREPYTWDRVLLQDFEVYFVNQAASASKLLNTFLVPRIFAGICLSSGLEKLPRKSRSYNRICLMWVFIIE